MTPDERPGLSGLAPEALSAWLAEQGEPAYRARQVADAVWGGAIGSFDEMLTLPAGLRERLGASFAFDTVADTDLKVADGGLTEKALHRLADGALIESVLMHYPARPGSRERHTLCISSQAGCAVGCPFCATGELGFGRDLEVAEIVDQVRSASRRLVADGQRLTNIVFMGMGEPLLNLDRVLAAIEALNDRRRFGLGARHITRLDVGRRPGHPAAHRARSAVHPGGLAPRGARPAARRARPAQPSLAGGRGRGGRPRPRGGDRPADQLRGHDDRRRQRHRGRRRRDGRPACAATTRTSTSSR